MPTSSAFQMLPGNKVALFFLPTATNILMLGFSKLRFFSTTFMGNDYQKSLRSCWKWQYLFSEIYVWNLKLSSDKPRLLQSLVGLWSWSQPIKCQWVNYYQQYCHFSASCTLLSEEEKMIKLRDWARNFKRRLPEP